MQQHETSMRLPVELLESIMSMVPASAIAPSLRTSSILRHIGQRVLYRHISNDKFTLDRSRSLLLTLSSKPELALLVRTITLRLPPKFGKQPSCSPPFAKDWDLLDEALRKTVNIEKLDLPLPRYGPDLLHRVVYPQLNSLKFMALPESSVTPFHDYFLIMHPNIRDLHIIGNSSSLVERLPSDALPQLTTLNITYPRHLISLAPKRPLKNVTITLLHHGRASLPSDLAISLSCLSKVSGTGVEVLKLDLQSGLGVNLHSVLNSLAGLPVVHLTLEFVRNGSPTLDQLGDLISTLAQLRTFAVTHFPNYLNDCHVDQSILDWFILCPSLESAAFIDRDIVHRRFEKRIDLSTGTLEHGAVEDKPMRINITWRKFDELRTLLDEPEEFSQWMLVGYIWENVGGNRQDEVLPRSRMEDFRVWGHG